MGKADLRLSDTKVGRLESVTDHFSEPLTPSRAADPGVSQVRARRFGLLLMIASSLLTVILIGAAWVMIGRLL